VAGAAGAHGAAQLYGVDKECCLAKEMLRRTSALPSPIRLTETAGAQRPQAVRLRNERAMHRLFSLSCVVAVAVGFQTPVESQPRRISLPKLAVRSELQARTALACSCARRGTFGGGGHGPALVLERFTRPPPCAPAYLR